MIRNFVVPDRAIEKHLAILGKTGSGKTTLARATVERVFARGERACILDPTGVWWGIRMKASGRVPSGLDVVIIGGRHADLPLAPDAGERIAAIVGTSSSSVVLDTSLLSVGGRTRFFTDFANALLRENRGTLHVVVDEAHLFAPQGRVADPQSANMVHAANNLVSLGRARGLRITLISQRPAKLHKDSLTQVETLVTLRLIAPQDRKAVEDWIGGQADKKEGAAIVASLPSLGTGEGWIWSPEIELLEHVAFKRPKTFDSSRPGADEEVAELVPIDVAALRAALDASAVAPEPGRRQVPASPRPDPDAIAAAEKRGYEQGLAAGLLFARDAVAVRSRLVDSAVESCNATIERLAEFNRSIRSFFDEPVVAAPRLAEPSPGSPADMHPGAGPLNSAARKMLAVLDTNPPVRRSWTQIATLAGIKARGGHFNAGRKGLLDGKLVLTEGDLVVIAQPSASATEARTDPASIVETWARSLSGAAPKILRDLFAHGGVAPRSVVADRLGMKPTGGHWNSAWKELRDNDLVRVEGDAAHLTTLFMPAA